LGLHRRLGDGRLNIDHLFVPCPLDRCGGDVTAAAVVVLRRGPCWAS
jgi:hypothetical protein